MKVVSVVATIRPRALPKFCNLFQLYYDVRDLNLYLRIHRQHLGKIIAIEILLPTEYISIEIEIMPAYAPDVHLVMNGELRFNMCTPLVLDFA